MSHSAPMCADLPLLLETLRHILGNDNTLRSAAEKRYEEAKRTQPGQTVTLLVQILQESQVEQFVREQGAVLLRQCLNNASESDSIWSQLGEAAQIDVRTRLLGLLEVEPQPSVRRKVADCVQSLGNQLIKVLSDQRPKNAEAWPDLLPILLKIICDSSKDTGTRADCLWVVHELTTSIWQILLASADQTYQVLHLCFADPANAVRANAAKLLCKLIDQIESKVDREPFIGLRPEFTSVLTQLAQSDDSDHIELILQDLIDCSEMVDYLKMDGLTQIIPVLCGVAKSHASDGARRYALEVMVTFMQNKPKMICKIPNYIEQALETCIHFLMELDDDLTEWAEEDDETAEIEESYVYAKEVVDRICRCATQVDQFPQLLEVMKPAITKLFMSGEWKQVVASIATISQIAEYIEDEATVVQMLQVIKTQLASTHVRISYAAWGAVAQFAVDHGDVIGSDSWAGEFMPEFVKAFDHPCKRVVLRSMEAFQHYGELIERENLEPFVQPLMEKLFKCLQSSSDLQRKAITFIAVIARQVEDDFAPYYGQLMPFLKNIIESIIHKVEERTLLGKCFECISLLAKAVGRNGFRADAELIMQAMIQATQVPNLPDNDPVKEYVMSAAERICSTMKADFLPFVPHILPGILAKLTLAPKVFDTKDTDNFEDGDEINLTLVPENGKLKILMMQSSEMQDLRGSLECVHTFVEELGRSYVAYVAQTAQALLPVFDFAMAEDIRNLAFETWGQLCCCAREEGQVQIVGELVNEFLKRILPKFDVNEVDVMAFKTRADGVTTCLQKAGPGILTAEQIKHICQITVKLLDDSFERRADGSKDENKQADDDGNLDDDDDDDTAEQPLRTSLCEIAGALMQHHPDIFVAEGFPPFLTFVQRLLQPQVSVDDRKLAFYVICDFLEHLGTRVTIHWPVFMPHVLEETQNQSVELRQPACYGLSHAAKDPAFATLAIDAAGKLIEVVNSSRKVGKKKSDKMAQACADNALSALIEILLNHHVSVAAIQGQLWNVWLSGLPCQMDDQEGVKNHKILLNLVQQQRPEVLGEGGQNISKLVSIFVDLYKSDMVDEETSNGIRQLIVQIGNAQLEQYATNYTAKQRKKISRIFREAQVNI